MFLSVIISNLVVSVVKDNDQKGNSLGSLRVQRKHFFHLHLRLLFYLLVFTLDVGVAVDFYEES